MSNQTVTVGLAPWPTGERVVGYACLNAGACVECDDYGEMRLIEE